MKTADLEVLKDKIVRPDIDKHLVPLMLYRGANNMEAFGRMSRVWNFAITMMESEVENFSEAVRVSASPDFAHLCGPRRPIQYNSFGSTFGRLRDNPRVTDNIPGLTDYVRSVQGPKWRLTPISIYTNDPGRKGRNWAPWRINDYSPEEQARRATQSAAMLAKQIARKAEADKKQAERNREKMLNTQSKVALFYPYLIHKPKEGDAERELLIAVNKAVSPRLPDYLRADICQDLIVAILSGEIARDELDDNARGYVSKVLRMHPFKYGPLSLDAKIYDEGESTLGDVLSLDPIESY